MTTSVNNYLRTNKSTVNDIQKRVDRPVSFHLLTQCNENMEEKKQIMTKNEIEDLRDSVLRSNRPVNPWCAAQKPTYKIYSTSMAGTSGTSIKENPSINKEIKSDTHFQNKLNKIEINLTNKSTKEKINKNNESLFRAQPIKVNKEEKLLNEKTLLNNLNYYTLNNNNWINPENQIENLREEIDYSNFLTPELSLLKQLEKEHYERRELLKNPYKNRNFDTYTSAYYKNSPESSSTYSSSSSNLSKKNEIVLPILNTNKLLANQKKLKINNKLTSPKVTPILNKLENQRKEPSNIDTYYCFACKELIEDVILQAVGESYHPSCFQCSQCSCNLDGVPFVVNNADMKKVFCMKDYEKNQIPYCYACKKKITAINNFGQIVRVLFQNKEYHIDCYHCEGCGLQFNNETENRCHPLNKHLLCRTCHIHWKRFGGINQPITDL